MCVHLKTNPQGILLPERNSLQNHLYFIQFSGGTCIYVYKCGKNYMHQNDSNYYLLLPLGVDDKVGNQKGTRWRARALLSFCYIRSATHKNAFMCDLN